MEGVGRGLRTFGKPHQCVPAGARGGAEHVLLRSTTRPVSLDTTDTSNFPSLSGLLSLSVHAPPCPPLARTRPQGTRTSCTRRRSRDSWPVGLLLGCGSCGRWWALEGLFAPPTKRVASHDECWGRDGECLWTLFAQPTILASIVAPQALTYRSASLACNENLFPSPQTPLVLVQLRKNPENLQIVTRLKFPIFQMYSLYSCTVTLQRLLNRESNNWSSRSSGRWCTLCRRNTVQQRQNDKRRAPQDYAIGEITNSTMQGGDAGECSFSGQHLGNLFTGESVL